MDGEMMMLVVETLIILGRKTRRSYFTAVQPASSRATSCTRSSGYTGSHRQSVSNTINPLGKSLARPSWNISETQGASPCWDK